MTAPLASTAPHCGYGGDTAGLICGYLMQDGGHHARPLDSTEAVQWLEAHRQQGAAPDTAAPHAPAQPAAFVWLHFNLAHAQAVRWMQRHADLPDAFFEALKDGSYSTRIERDDDAINALESDLMEFERMVTKHQIALRDALKEAA